jgi:hypothetical protein
VNCLNSATVAIWDYIVELEKLPALQTQGDPAIMVDRRAICHEAGHAIAALRLGFEVNGIEMSEGFPRTVMALDSPQKTTEQCCVVLAAGIAAEEVAFGRYDREACGLDQNMIYDRGGGAISDYLSEASNIVRSNESCLQQLRERLTARWVEEEATAMFEPDCNSLSFELLSRTDIEGICSGRS